MRGAVLVLTLLTAGCHAQVRAPEPLHQWRLAAGWRSETAAVPLEFAPSLPYHGVEELRFMPGFFKPDQPGYWSYAFVWWLDRPGDIGAAALGRAIEDYFAGLAAAVDRGHPQARERFHAQLQADAAGGLSGTVASVDPFATHQPLELRVRVRPLACASAAQVLLFAFSPRPAEDAVWRQLEAQLAAFHC